MEIRTIQKGKTFYPVSAFRNKLFLYILTIFIAVTGSIIIFGGIIAFLVSLDEDTSGDNFGNWLATNSQALIGLYLLFSFVIMIGAAILVILYVRNIKYIIEDTEIIVKKGIINRTVKHVPFRTITNVSSRYGVFDRIFGIGTCEIQTAGKSGAQGGPEEKIEGVRNFIEVRDVILNELRRFRGQYATTTELDQPVQYDDSIRDLTIQEELLDELRQIKEVLSKKT